MSRSVRTVAVAGLVAAALTQPSSAERQAHRIEMMGVAFAPAQLTVHTGDIVEWDNRDAFAHTATSKPAGFDVDVMPGGRGSTVMSRIGTFSYHCRYHPNMGGKIIVEP